MEERERKTIEQRLINVLSSEKINTVTFCMNAKIDRSKLTEVKRMKSSFTSDEIIAIKSEVNKFRIELKGLISELEKYSKISSLTEKKLIAFFSKKFIKLNKTFDKETYTKIDGWKLKRRIFPDESRQKIIDSLSLLIIETVI